MMMKDDGGNRDAPLGDHRRAEDSISSLPDEILQHILSLIPTKLAIRTSVLSKRWRHVWSDTPSLSFDSFRVEADSINKALACYRARKIMNFQLCASKWNYRSHTDKWIQFAMSRNVENLLLEFQFNEPGFHIPNFFYRNSSVKKLSVKLCFCNMIPRCSVSWTSLKKLYLHCCTLSDESFSNILSGCPILERLTLSFCVGLMVLHLSKSPRLRILEIDPYIWGPGPTTQIVAPHIHCLRLRNSPVSCTFVHVSSLTEAILDIYFFLIENVEADFVQDLVLKMLENLQNVEKLTFGANLLKASFISCRAPWFSFSDVLKAKTLTLETMISPYVIPGIVRMLQNSPELKKLIIHTKDRDDIIPEHFLDKYLDLHGLNLDQYRVYGKGFPWNLESKHVALFMKLMLNTTKTLEKMVVRLVGYPLKVRVFEELVEMIPKLSRNSNVSIVLAQRSRVVVFN